MKNSFCVFLALLLLCGLYVPAEAAGELVHPPLNEELIINGDFSTAPDNATDWVAFGGDWTGNAYTAYVSDPLNEENHCVKVTDFKGANGKVSNPYAKQELSVVPGATYVLSARVYSDKKAAEITSENGSALIKLEFFNKGGGESKLGSYQVTGGVWIEVEHEIQVPAASTGMRILLRQQGVGHMYFDDVSLKMTKVPDAIHIETDEVFYYSDHTADGVATATLNTLAYPDLSGASVDFYLKKGSEVLAQSLSVATVESKAVFSFDTSLLSEKGVEYVIEAAVCGYTDERCNSAWKIYKYDRPKAMDESGTYYRMEKNADGILERTREVVYPVFAYRYRDYQFELGVPNGIVVAQLAMPQNKDGSYYDEDATVAYLQNALDNAKEKGVMCMIALYRSGKPAGNEANFNNTKRVVQEFCNHEAVFGWMVMDETFTHFSNPHEDLRKSYVLIRNIDPNHPVYLCEATTRLTEAGRYADILAVDPYPASYEDTYDNNPNSPYAAAAVFPSERVSLAVEAVGDKKPVYSLLQAFRWDDSHPDYFPTGDEMRNMLYQSLIAGASGVGYFKFDNSDGSLDLNATPLWPYITAFSQNEQTNAFDAFVYDKYPIFSDMRNDDFWAVSFVKDGTVHLVVLNRRKTEEQITVPLVSKDGTKEIRGYSAVCAAGSADTAVSGTNTLTANLPAGGAALYKITPEAYRTYSFYESFEKSTVAEYLEESMLCARENNGNHYASAPLSITVPALPLGEACKVAFKAMPNSDGKIPIVEISGESEIQCTDADEPEEGKWTEYVGYFTPSANAVQLVFDGEVAYDDIRVAPAETEIMLFQNGLETETVSSGTVSAHLYNASETALQFFLAIYQGNGGEAVELIDCKAAVCPPGTNSDTVLSLEVPDGTNYSVRAFAWDGVGSMKPYLK